MIGGIFETIGKTLGVGKEQYFLELDETAEESVKSLQKSASKATKAAVETVKEATAEVADKAQEAVDTAQEATAEIADKAQTIAADNNGKPGKKSTAKKGGSKTVVASSDKAIAPKAKQPAAPKAPSPEELIVNAIAANGKALDSSGNVVDEAQTFSTDFLMPPSRSRRRPGPGLNGFRGMAKSVNPRLRG